MPKIKDIHARLIKDPGEYSGITFKVAQRAFLIVVTLYFLTLLGTVGGFYLSWISLETLSMVRYHLYSLVIIATIWFGFSSAEYITFIHTPGQRWIAYAVLLILTLIGGTALFVHLSPIFSTL